MLTSGDAFDNTQDTHYGYNTRNEVISSYSFIISEDPPPLEIGTARRIYGYDPIGNRETSITGAAGLTTTYNINNQVNQYSSTTNPSETFKYDADGNMTEDGTAEYTYDAENRLIKVVKSVAGNTEVQYTYDYMGRRVRSKSFYYGNPNGDIKYVFDGWLAVAELNGSISDQFVRAYTWGQDLSGSRDGAGGVGGLLSMTRADGVDYGYFYDANGNVTQVVRLTDGQVSANYRYDPFGNSIGQFDSINNPFRFSTKAFDYLTQLYYYGYRYYSPRLGRWITRDPIGEWGGINQVGFIGNNGINICDMLGLFDCTTECERQCRIVGTIGQAWCVPRCCEYQETYCKGRKLCGQRCFRIIKPEDPVKLTWGEFFPWVGERVFCIEHEFLKEPEGNTYSFPWGGTLFRIIAQYIVRQFLLQGKLAVINFGNA
jgi:RHS repeat-associated protein